MRDGSALAVSYSDVQGGASGEGNIAADPLFRNPAAGDYRLQETSPVKDEGGNGYIPTDVSTDLDGNTRIVNTTVEMGANEYQ